MELRQLRAFLQVAGARHFGRAAAALKITQPALTQRIQALERELGVQLLTRSAREVRLTPAGEVLLPYADSLIHVEDRALRELADNAAGRAGRLRITYSLHSDIPVMGAIMAEFRRCYPKVEIEAGSGYSVMNAEQVAAGLMDAAFVSLPTPRIEIVATQRISDDPVLVAVGERHPFAQMERVPVKALAGMPMILVPSALNPLLTAAFKRWLADRSGAELNVIAEEPLEQAALVVAKSDGVVAFGSSRWASAASMPGVVTRPLTPAPMTTFGIAYRRDDASPHLANLLQIVDQVANRTNIKAPADAELIA